LRKIKWDIRLAPSMQDGEFNAPDDATNDEIEELAKEYAFNGVDWGWIEVKESPKREGKTL
jgi:hypothetical protein